MAGGQGQLICVCLLAFTGLQLVGGQDITVSVSLSSASLGPDHAPLTLTCEFNLVQYGWILHSLRWTGPQGDMYDYRFNRAINTPINMYLGRLSNFDSLTATSHTLTLKNATWCSDLGTYTCTVTRAENNRAISAHGHAELRGHESPPLLHSDSDNVHCIASWPSDNMQVLLSDGARNVVKTGVPSDAGADGKCTHIASATLDKSVPVKQREKGSFSCTVSYGNVTLEPVWYTPTHTPSAAVSMHTINLIMALIFTFPSLPRAVLL